MHRRNPAVSGNQNETKWTPRHSPKAVPLANRVICLEDKKVPIGLLNDLAMLHLLEGRVASFFIVYHEERSMIPKLSQTPWVHGIIYGYCASQVVFNGTYEENACLDWLQTHGCSNSRKQIPVFSSHRPCQRRGPTGNHPSLCEQYPLVFLNLYFFFTLLWKPLLSLRFSCAFSFWSPFLLKSLLF